MRKGQEVVPELPRQRVDKARKAKNESRFSGWEDKRDKRAKSLELEGTCDCCHKDGKIIQTDEGDFCGECIGKMTWLR